MLHKPAAGQAAQVTVRPDGLYRCDFYTHDVSFDRSGEELQFHFSDGALLSLQDFFTVARQHDFTIELPDGTQLAGQEMASVLTMTLEDFHTDGPLAAADSADGADAPTLLLPTGEALFANRELAALLEPDEDGLAPYAASLPAPFEPDGTPALDRSPMLFAAPEPEDVLHLDDLLTASHPALPLPPGHVSTFEAMVGAEGKALPPAETDGAGALLAADLTDLDPDSLLLAFLRMGSL